MDLQRRSATCPRGHDFPVVAVRTATCMRSCFYSILGCAASRSVTWKKIKGYNINIYKTLYNLSCKFRKSQFKCTHCPTRTSSEAISVTYDP